MQNIDSIFIIIGAQRSGSTYLYRQLDRHPSICMAKPVRPEPKYFLTDSPYSNISEEDYLTRFFSHRLSEKILGEKSTSYYEDSGAPERISKLFPSAKILMIVRNPIERAISNYKFSLENGYETRNIEEALATEDDFMREDVSVSPFNYLGRGLYFKFLKNFDAYFPKESIKVIIFEELVDNFCQINEALSFVGASGEVELQPDRMDAVNASKTAPVFLSSRLRKKLRNYFEPSIEELCVRLGRRIEVWE